MSSIFFTDSLRPPSNWDLYPHALKYALEAPFALSGASAFAFFSTSSRASPTPSMSFLLLLHNERKFSHSLTCTSRNRASSRVFGYFARVETHSLLSELHVALSSRLHSKYCTSNYLIYCANTRHVTSLRFRVQIKFRTSVI